jgi:hypothetical protein
MMSPRATLSLLCIVCLLTATGCRRTGKLSAEQISRFEQEGIKHRADDLTFRRTTTPGQRDSTWEDKTASIIVTAQSVFLHVNGKSLVEITPRSTGFYEVHRDHDRISLHAGGGTSAASWSFRPPDNAESWADDIRAVIKNSRAK